MHFVQEQLFIWIDINIRDVDLHVCPAFVDVETESQPTLAFIPRHVTSSNHEAAVITPRNLPLLLRYRVTTFSSISRTCHPAKTPSKSKYPTSSNTCFATQFTYQG